MFPGIQFWNAGSSVKTVMGQPLYKRLLFATIVTNNLLLLNVAQVVIKFI